MKPLSGAKRIMEIIGDWESCDIPIAKKWGWERWGLLGILADYVLNYTNGGIVEIGVGESSVFLTKLAEKYDREIFYCDISGTAINTLKSMNGFFKSDGQVFLGSSDDFFQTVELPSIALGFIDGDHHYEFVKRDFDNLFSYLVDNGYIFIHDTYPKTEEFLDSNKCGTGYRL